jgi:alpha-ribazole phosphatase
MNLNLTLIRHGKTAGNLEEKYIGVTDEPLCESGISFIKQLSNQGIYKATEQVFSSPKTRCIQTAQIIYPNKECYRVDSFAECDFGIFEGKNYEQLKDNPEYQRFIDSGGKGIIPGGEATEYFKERCCEGFLWVTNNLLENGGHNACIVCHGGTIMSIMERFDEEKKDFYSYQVKNGLGYIVKFDTKTKKITKTINLEQGANYENSVSAFSGIHS